MSHQKLKLAELNRLDLEAYKRIEKAPVIFVLDNIRSAQNIGSIFRTSDAFNIEKIVLTGISATPPNKEILKTALGSTESVIWEHRHDTVEAIQQLQKEGYRIISVEQTQNSTLLHQFIPDVDSKYVLVLGNEVEGVSQEVINLSDLTLEIPQFGTKHSLNVAVSAGIVLWDLYNKQFLQQG
jgi:23S rRNA (guanosine2251-2'-O)-methyltransferase